jgi:formylglycine-generating enzyme required for sulfatase activity
LVAYFSRTGNTRVIAGQIRRLTIRPPCRGMAQEFISALNAREGHQRYRLPTEAEWEYAARAGTTTSYSFDNARSDLGGHAWFGEDFATGDSHPVGWKAPNPWGLYDIHGNAWE